MFQWLSLRALTLMPYLLAGGDSGKGAAVGGGTGINGTHNNPLYGALQVVKDYQKPIQDTCYGIAVLAIIVCGGLLMCAGAQMRARIKSHLIWILVSIIIITAVGYLVGFSKNEASSDFSTIMPVFKSYLATFLPNI